jgi:glycosyltransferase involved in cell wall biosynthesis
VPRAGFFINGWRVRKTLAAVHRRHPIDVIDGTELSFAALPRSFPANKIIRMSGGHHFFAVTLGKRPRPWRSWLERRSFARADHLCGVSHFVAETTRSLLDLGGRPIEVLPNPVDTTLFRPRPEIAENMGLIVFVGTVCEKKGVRQLIQAMPEIVRAVPDACLWLVGRDYKDENGGSYLEQYRRLVPESMQQRIVFKGPVEHDALPEVLARAHVCVYPSHMEAQGIVNLEAMAMGKAVVSSHTGPGPEIVQDGVSGLLCNPHDPTSIANRIITLMKDNELRRRIGEEARRWVVERFSAEVLIERNESFHRQCISRGHAA